MGTEIERKFLVKGDAWRSPIPGKRYCQGYVVQPGNVTVRVRIAGDRGFLTLKGKAENFARPEFEYEIPVPEAQEMLDLWCRPRIVDKIRYRIPVGDLVWEVDEFLGFNQGLILAEVELQSSDQCVDLPDWVGLEVSEEHRYYNSSLAIHPYAQWTQDETG
jgi:adenylate cyclase